jgi:thiosulfate dehydrogenase
VSGKKFKEEGKMKRSAGNKLFCLCCMAAFAFSLSVLSASALEIEKLPGKTLSELVWGGILYDNWPKELGVKIDKTHPAYPPAGKKKGETTWRCKECHGWDYKGRVGIYSKGDNYTGIKGIRDNANQNPEEIIKILKSDTHAFGDMLPERALKSLALFVSLGQIDMDPYIDRATKKPVGDPISGGRIYLTTCLKCHGEDGKKINFKDEKTPEYIGTVAKKNPWEALHKVRFGHPEAQMPAMVFLGLREQLDLLSFCQTLPEK